jgi:hypothetical protein
MNSGTVEAIHIAPDAEAELQALDDAEAVAGRGLKGDRYYKETGTFTNWEPGERPNGSDLTLIEAEAVEAIERDADIRLALGEHRRNITTRNVALNHLVGERFKIGDVLCRGDRLCEPCSHIESLTQDGIRRALLHRGGLRADILEDGVINMNDTITVL